MTDHAELRRLAKAATPGARYQGTDERVIIAGNGTIICTVSGAISGPSVMADAEFLCATDPKTILALLDEIDGMKASGWRNHSVNYARAEKCPQTLETAQAVWDRDQELIEEQRQQIARDSQTINKLRQKLQSAEVDRDRLKAELEQSASVLPGNYYMDPPDGGNVSIPEQIRRMAKDAARYRALRQKERGVVVVRNRTSHLFGEHLDAAIDAAIEGAKQ
ncbi:hypothetical protein LZL11_24155 [Pseudomonas aeruginosa]|uniref:hypothetical protein n=1 Tax=Pseudomonas aeruginosa TaxID=287 RepID=UPI0029C00CAC|nr:hypothetical protein [Pseudomonas aeruginosa]MCT5287590.1 hypothetical protein [Pseudomonas aeruginosa]